MGLLFHIRRTPLGWVAGFCPFCRAPRACRLLKVAKKRHSTLLGQRPLPERELQCSACGLRWPTRAERYPRGGVPDAADDFDALKAATDPGFDATFGSRLALEAKLARGSLTAQEREHLLSEPFLYAEHMVAQQEGWPRPSPFMKRLWRIGLWSGAGFLVAMAVHEFTDSDVALDVMAVLCLVAVPCLLLARVGSLFTARSWFRKRCVEPALVRALQPLQPSRAELVDAFDRLRREKALLPRVIDPLRLHGLLEE